MPPWRVHVCTLRLVTRIMLSGHRDTTKPCSFEYNGSWSFRSDCAAVHRRHARGGHGTAAFAWPWCALMRRSIVKLIFHQQAGAAHRQRGCMPAVTCSACALTGLGLLCRWEASSRRPCWSAQPPTTCGPSSSSSLRHSSSAASAPSSIASSSRSPSRAGAYITGQVRPSRMTELLAAACDVVLLLIEHRVPAMIVCCCTV